MAEAYFNAVPAPAGVRAESAGLCASAGAPMSAAARRVLAERGIDGGGFRSRPLTAELAAAADIIVGMTHAHCRETAARFPECAKRTTALPDLPGGGDITDPFGGDEETYRRCLDRMIPALEALAEKIKRNNGPFAMEANIQR
ncbi:MAG: low molecular weight protein arginine phosphatase [Lentisphaeria bacterium]|nr:low molecular weight protein arginine phosphatase [Lentisphaeria bacterium]